MAVFSPEVWVPLSAYDVIANDYGSMKVETLSTRGGNQLMLIGRLKPGQTAAAAEPALKTLAGNLERAFPVEQKDQTFTTRPLSRFSISDIRRTTAKCRRSGPYSWEWRRSFCWWRA